MQGDLHFRLVSRFGSMHRAAQVRAAEPGRALFMHAVPWKTPTRIIPPKGEPYDEWFNRGSVRMSSPRPGFWLHHRAEGGVRVGVVAALVNGAGWLDAVALVDEGPVGDALLEDIGADGAGLPVSIAFETLPGGMVRHGGPGIERTRVRLSEIAIVDAAAYPAARIYARGSLSSLAAMQAAAA